MTPTRGEEDVETALSGGDAMEVESLRVELADVEDRIARLEAKRPDDGLGDSFHLGRVGGSGKAVRALDRKRARDLDRTIDLAGELVPLYRERDRLQRKIEDHESGKVEAKRNAKEARAERVRNAKVGDRVLDSAFGMVKVARVNRKSLTIETASGYREARPFSLIVDISPSP